MMVNMAGLSDVVPFVGWEPMLTSVAIALAVAWYIRSQVLPIAPNLPPGPPRIPAPFHLVAALVAMNKGLQPFFDLQKRYGDLVFLHFGSKSLLLVSSYDYVKDILIDRADVTSDRKTLRVLDQFPGHNQGSVGLTSGKVWHTNRKFSLQALRSMGLGKYSIQNKVLEEADVVSEKLAEMKGRPFAPRFMYYTAVSNVMCSTVFGHRFEYTDAKFQDVISKLDAIANSDELGIVIDIPLVFLRKTTKHFAGIKALMEEEIAKHAKVFDANDTKDVIDKFLDEIERAKKAGEEMTLDRESLWATIFDLFSAGSEPTTTYLCWLLVFLAGEPEAKSKIMEEIDTVIGPGRKPAYEDRKQMHYTQAFMTEVLRFRPNVPIGAPHLTTSDLTVDGYHVPKGTEVVMNMLGILHDPRVWKDPDVFRPERFLSEDGLQFVKRPEVVTFGAGKRSCLGQQFGKTEAFLFITCLLQRFDVNLPESVASCYDFANYVQGLSPLQREFVFTER